MNKDWKKAEDILKNNGVVVLPTDTLYGLVGSAFSQKAVERIYKIKNRDKKKPFIVLISSIDDLKKFGVDYSHILENIGMLEKVFIPKTSILLPCANKTFSFLHRGTKKIAFRKIYPRNKNLFNLIKKVGPIIAPSANLEGLKPAESIRQAKEYFGEDIDLYINGGIKKTKPSTLIEVVKGKIKILRK